MVYKDVNVTCKYCGDSVSGNQQYMIGGRQLCGRRGRIPKWLKEKPEHKWEWNGLSDEIGGKQYNFEFYLCPKHSDDEHYKKALNWAQEQIDGIKALQELVV